MTQNYFKIILCFAILSVGMHGRAAADFPPEFLESSAEQYSDVWAERVLSADKIILNTGERIKLIGLLSPEMPKNKNTVERDSHGFIIEKEADPVTPVEEQSLQFTRTLLEGKKVRLEFDVLKKNQAHETTAYVFLADGTMANVEILRNGFAHLQLSPPNLKYAQLLRDAYREAKTEKRGLQNE
ncbi:MAG: thermonuclease family protein [Candidatus Omnitrophota bacterium]